MISTWKHSELGTFKHDGELGWVGECDLPAFNIFTYESDDEEITGKCEVVFDSEDEETEPSDAAAALAALVVANQKKLAPLVTKAMWEDFNGRGPKTGMWWSGDMKQVAEVFGYSERPCPTSPDDLLPAMRLSSITVHEEMHDYDGPVVELHFRAVFEMEHGIGVLTDGNKIVGLGYSCDVTPFESE